MWRSSSGRGWKETWIDSQRWMIRPVSCSNILCDRACCRSQPHDDKHFTAFQHALLPFKGGICAFNTNARCCQVSLPQPCLNTSSHKHSLQRTTPQMDLNIPGRQMHRLTRKLQSCCWKARFIKRSHIRWPTQKITLSNYKYLNTCLQLFWLFCVIGSAGLLVTWQYEAVINCPHKQWNTTAI